MTHIHNVSVVGVQKARKIAAIHQLPIVGVHHMEAHALVARYSTLTSFQILKMRSDS